jgi:hypothetical protein
MGLTVTRRHRASTSLEIQMGLPSQAQVNTAARYAGTIAGTAFAIFGLQAKGFSLDQIKIIISDLGNLANDFIILIAAVAPIYATIRGISSSSPTGQAASIGANPSTIVNAAPGGTATVTINDPAMATAALTAQKNAA